VPGFGVVMVVTCAPGRRRGDRRRHGDRRAQPHGPATLDVHVLLLLGSAAAGINAAAASPRARARSARWAAQRTQYEVVSLVRGLLSGADCDSRLSAAANR
jgi:hypothetical protein